MSVYCILRGGHIRSAHNIVATDDSATFLWLRVVGPSAQAFDNAFKADAPAADLHIPGSPTFDRSPLPARYADAIDGLQVWGVERPTGPDADAETFAARHRRECYLRGEGVRLLNRKTREAERRPFVGLELVDATPLAVIEPAVIVWRSDTGGAYSTVAAKYRDAIGPIAAAMAEAQLIETHRPGRVAAAP